MAAAARELEEETQHGWTQIDSWVLHSHVFREWKSLSVATNLKPVENPRPLDEDEFLEIYELTYEECMELVFQVH